MHMFLMGIFWYHLYDMSNYKLCNLDTYNHNFGSRSGVIWVSRRQGQPPPKGRRADGRHATGYLRRKYRSLLGNFPSRNTTYR